MASSNILKIWNQTKAKSLLCKAGYFVFYTSSWYSVSSCKTVRAHECVHQRDYRYRSDQLAYATCRSVMLLWLFSSVNPMGMCMWVTGISVFLPQIPEKCFGWSCFCFVLIMLNLRDLSKWNKNCQPQQQQQQQEELTSKKASGLIFLKYT